MDKLSFPEYISFTITNACNLRCRMCGQWSEEGYIKNGIKSNDTKMKLKDWIRIVDEAAEHKIKFILVRGGEPFLYPGVLELLEHINRRGIFISIDTNGTMMEKYAGDLVRLGNMHITFSVDGPEEIHDKVRNVKGSFKKIKENIALLNELEKNSNKKISKSICFTISKDSYKGLGSMAEVARSMEIPSVSIVPYYYFSSGTGKKYEEELMKDFGCYAFSWKGFHHEDSGINFDMFLSELRKYRSDLKGISNFEYMPMTEDDFKIWFGDSFTPVRSTVCMSVEKLIDIQPGGDANFCVDFPDYSFGNVLTSPIKEIWNSEKAIRFREYRREKPLAVCYRCGARYMAEHD